MFFESNINLIFIELWIQLPWYRSSISPVLLLFLGSNYNALEDILEHQNSYEKFCQIGKIDFTIIYSILSSHGILLSFVEIIMAKGVF